MDCFQVLGIEPVKDENMIRSAYFEKLRTCNPEENPAGFMELRKALEEALESLKEPEMLDPPEIRELTKKLNEIYREFAHRIDIDVWTELLREPVCQEFDSEAEAGRAILAFVMDHHRLPHRVVKLLAEHFAWEEKKEELTEQFPEGFIDFILNHAEFDDPINYYEFPILEEFDYDDYIGTFYRLGKAVNDREEEAAREMYEKILTFPIEHPDTLEMRVRYCLYITREYEEAFQLAGELLEKYGRGGTRQVAYGRAGLSAGKMEEIAPLMEGMKNSDDENELKLYGDYLCRKEDYENALLYFYKAKENAEEEWPALEEGIAAASKELAKRYLSELEGQEAEEAAGQPQREAAGRAPEEAAGQPQRGAAGGAPEKAAGQPQREAAGGAPEEAAGQPQRGAAGGAPEEAAGQPQREAAGRVPEEAADRFCGDREALMWKTARLLYDARLYDKAKQLLKEMTPPPGHEEEYYKWLADSCRNTEEYEEAVVYREKLRQWQDGMPDPVRLHWDLGCDYESAENYEKAMEEFEAGLKKDPDNWVWLFKRAEILYYQDKDDESIELCDRIMDERGFISQVFNLKVKNFFDKGDYGTLIDQAEYVIEQGYHSPLVYFDYASSLRRVKRYDDAYKYLNILIEENGEDGIVCEEMARVFHDQSKDEEALTWADKALGYESTRTRQYLKADILSDLSRYEEEMAIYESIISQGEGYYHTYYRLAYAQEQLKRFSEAEDNYRKSLEEKPDNYWARCSLADTLQKQRRFEEAAEQYKLAMENPQSHKWCVWNLSRLLRRMRRLDEAYKYVCAGMERFPEESCLVLTAARICRSKKDYENAIRYMKRYGEMKENQGAYVLRMIGDYYADAGQYGEAEKAYQQSLETDGEDGVSWRFYGQYYLVDRKDPEKALPFLKKAVELNDGSDRSLKLLADAYELLGDRDKAAELYGKAYEAAMKDVREDSEDACNIWSVAEMLFFLGRYEEALEMANKASDYVSQYFNCPYCDCQEALEVAAWSEAKLGRDEEALETIARARALDDDLSDRTEEVYRELTKAGR